MATKKSSKPTTKSKTKPSAQTVIIQRRIGQCFIAFGILTAVLLSGFFYLLNQRPTYADQQKLAAFDGLVNSYIYDHFTITNERAASVIGSGITKDHDLYYDFVITSFEDHIPVTAQKARLHFQCHEQNSLKLKDAGCAYAYWYDEVHETSAKYREQARTYLEMTENYVNRSNAAESDADKDALRAEYEKFAESYKDFNWLGLE